MVTLLPFPTAFKCLDFDWEYDYGCIFYTFPMAMPFGHISATQPAANAIMFANCYLI